MIIVCNYLINLLFFDCTLHMHSSICACICAFTLFISSNIWSYSSCIHVSMHTYINAYMNWYKHSDLGTHVCINVCNYAFIVLHACVQTHTYTHSYIIHLHRRACINAFMCQINTRTHTHVCFETTRRAFKSITLIHCCLSGCCSLSESRCWGFQRHVWPFSLAASSWNVILCTNLIVFDVSPQGFKGKTGHVGFPGQKVSQQLVAFAVALSLTSFCL